MYHFNYSKQGMTMMETTVVLGILAIVSVAVTWIVIHSIRVNDIVWEQLITQSESRKVIHEMVNELRKAEVSSIGSYAIVQASPDGIMFYANIDETSARERLHYWVDGTTFKRGILYASGNPLSYSGVENVTEIAHNIYNAATANPVFLYYDENYSGSETALDQPVEIADIRAIRIQLDLERDPDKSPVPLHVESMVSIRNIKTN